MTTKWTPLTRGKILGDLHARNHRNCGMTATTNCNTCQAACCRMQVMIIDDTDMPERFIETDASGVQSMRRLDDGWCEALNRNTFLCDQYLVRPTICRQFEMGGPDCQRTKVDITAPWIGN